jgi:hypothetical protein
VNEGYKNKNKFPSETLLHSFYPWMLAAFRIHTLEQSAGTFPRKYGIHLVAWEKILANSPELLAIKKEYLQRQKKKRESWK